MISLCLSYLIQIVLILLQINEEEASLFDMLWLLLASVIFVPIFQKIPGGKWHLFICTLTPEVVIKKKGIISSDCQIVDLHAS